jgi:hypothetical protein
MKITKPKNLKEAKKLVKRYRSITIEEIERELKKSAFPRSIMGSEVAKELAGYGSSSTCTLCKVVRAEGCSECIYSFKKYNDFSCIIGANEKTYHAISDACTPTELLAAFKKRASHIEKTIKKGEAKK